MAADQPARGGAAAAGLGRGGRGRPAAADKLTGECQAFRGTLATKVYICQPADPEAKGLVERFHDYLERSFLPGRSFASPADFNAQLGEWIARANMRWHRRLECRPSDRAGADKAAMIPLPPVPPVTGWHKTARLPRDYYVRLDGSDYSVDPAVIGRRIEVSADLARVRVACDGRVVAAWPPGPVRDPSQVPGATGNQPRPHAGLRSERYASRPQRYPSGGGSPRRGPAS